MLDFAAVFDDIRCVSFDCICGLAFGSSGARGMNSMSPVADELELPIGACLDTCENDCGTVARCIAEAVTNAFNDGFSPHEPVNVACGLSSV
jgi:hypothetical protein